VYHRSAGLYIYVLGGVGVEGYYEKRDKSISNEYNGVVNLKVIC